MTGFFLLAASALLAVASAGLAWLHVVRIGKATSGEALRMANALKKVDRAERLAALQRLAPAGSWERALADELVEGRDDAWRVAIANDALSDLEHQLEAGAAWPRAAVRVAAFGGLLFAVIAYIATHDLGPALEMLGVAAVGAGAAVEAARRARAASKEQRQAVDALVEALMGPAVRDAADASSARKRRRRDNV